jgi:hypothetical protein bfra3_01503
MRRVLYLAIPVAMLLLHSCQCSRTPDAIVELRAYRLDSALMRGEGPTQVAREHPEFLKLWGEVLGSRDAAQQIPMFLQFADDADMQALEDSILRVFPSTTAYTQQLAKAFGVLKGQIPQLQIPKIYYFNGGFNTSIILADSMLGIGLDRFLGADCPYYPQLGIPHYLARTMSPAHIAPTAISSWLETEYPQPLGAATTLETMLHEGSILYATRLALKDLPDSLALGYSAQGLEWLEKNEHPVWVYLSEKKLLYERNSLIVNQLTHPAPFTNVFGQDSPGQVASWIGYRIVAQYMDKHPSITLAQLLAMHDGQEILKNAKYNP